jgi:hypothetical protein
MTADTILTAFRSISDLTTTQYPDADVEDKAEPYALAQYNEIMGTAYTITSHTTGSGVNVDRALAYWCASFAYQDKFPRVVGFGGGARWSEFEQTALSIMQKIEPTKVGFSTGSLMFYVIGKNRGNSQNAIQTGYGSY